MADDRIIPVGRIGSTYGVKGWLKVFSYTDPPENILQYQPWLFRLNNRWETIKVLEVEPYGKGFIILLAGIDNPEVGKRYANVDIGVYRHQFPALPEGEFYWSDLEGLTVHNLAGEILGIVDHLIDTGSNDVLIVKGEKEHLIPYLHDQVILKVDIAKKTILVDWEPNF